MNPTEKEKLLHQSIIDFLKLNPKGLTMSEIVRGTKFSRKAIEKHLQILTLENEIYAKTFGVTKVYYPNHRVQHFDFEKMNYNNKTFWFDILENEYGKYLLIQKKKKLDNTWVHEHSITIPLEECRKFQKTLGKIISSDKVKKLF
jgi:predicted transcriptional regulator